MYHIYVTSYDGAYWYHLDSYRIKFFAKRRFSKVIKNYLKQMYRTPHLITYFKLIHDNSDYQKWAKLSTHTITPPPSWAIPEHRMNHAKEQKIL